MSTVGSHSHPTSILVTIVTIEATLAQLGLIIQGLTQLWVLWLTTLTRYKLYKGLQDAKLISCIVYKTQF